MGSDARAGLPAGAGRLVYNMYRDMLKNYNDRANEILETKPAGCVLEDRGVADLVDSMARQLSSGQQMSSEPSANGGLPAPPPPPPPPPLGLGAVPAVRLKCEIGERREPPACVQNAMMTKDKKPFTYTPGGLDLSQIRSPRMARRLTRNAMSEGVQPQAAPSQGGPVPSVPAPQVQEGVVPQPPPPPPPMMMGPRPQVLPMQPPPVLPMHQPKAMPVQSPLAQQPKPAPVPSPLVQAPKPAQPVQSPLAQSPKVTPVQSPPVQSPPAQSPPVQVARPAPAVQVAPPPPVQPPVKAPQPRQPAPYQPPAPPVNQQREAASPPVQREVVIVTQPIVREAPGPRVPMSAPIVQSPPPTPQSAGSTVPDGHMRRQVNEPRSQVGSIYVPPLSPEEVAQRSGSNTPATPATSLNKAPTPWLTSRGAQQRADAPSWARATPPSAAPGERVIPVQIEYTSTPPSAASTQQQHVRPHVQVQRQPSIPHQQQQQFYQQQQQQQQQQRQREHVVRVIPIQIEGRRAVGNDAGLESPATGGPVQSPAFRVLERVTSRDEEIHNQPAVEHPPTVGHAFQKEQQTQARRDQREPEPRKYTGASIPSRSFQMLQAMVAPENCAADGTRADDLTGGDCPGSASDAATHPCPVPPWGHEALAYWPDPYWAYMHAPAPPTGDGGDSAPSDPCFWYAPPPPPPWDPYMAAAYWYGYWPPCTPHPPYTSASDTDEYSSTDEMGRYGLGWPQPPPPSHQQQADVTTSSTASDTEAELDRAGLQAIRSVSDIQVYKEKNGPLPGRHTATDIERSTSVSSASSSPSLSDNSSDDDDDDDEEFEVSECPTEDGVHVPHQLSVIFEESEVSDVERKKREMSVATTVSEDDSEATVAVHTADTDNDEPHDDWDGTCETTVTVRLPLKLKFGKSVNGANDVTEVVVGDSEVRSGGASSPRTLVPHLRRQRSDDTVENYETAESDNDTGTTERKIMKSSRNDNEDDVSDDEESVDDNDENGVNGVTYNNHYNDDATNAEEEEEEDDSDSDDSYENDSNDETENNLIHDKQQQVAAVSDIKEKNNNCVKSLNMGENENETAKLIEHLIINEPRSCVETDTVQVSVRQRVKAIEGQSSMECIGDEDIDSGVTSDVSRHTDTETESEMLRNRYQRAATHSRLYKLLQDECSKSDDEQEQGEGVEEGEEEEGRDGHAEGVKAAAVREPAQAARKQQMWLPLSGSDPESFSSSGVCSPASPTWAARGPAHEDALSNTSEDGSPLDSCYSSDYRSYFGSWERAAARARCPRVRDAPTPARAAAASPAPRRQAAGAS